MKIETVSVKVMRSFDYCHFEVAVSASDTQDVADVDYLRKVCARLVDKAVDQYKIAKRNFELMMDDASCIERIEREAKRISTIPEDLREPHDKAFMKAVEDKNFKIRNRYDYQDDYDESAPFRLVDFDEDPHNIF